MKESDVKNPTNLLNGYGFDMFLGGRLIGNLFQQSSLNFFQKQKQDKSNNKQILVGS